MELRLLVDRREDLVGQRTAAINRLLGRVHHLDPERRVPTNWNKKARAEMGTWLSARDGLIAELAREEAGEIARLSDDMVRLGQQIGHRVRAVAGARNRQPRGGGTEHARDRPAATLSPRTVEGHIYHACTKLAVPDRKSLAEFMRRTSRA